ncbi:MAG: hypothetical protein RBT45_07720, partial [Acholeplasmataceae bacterium]|nr:hypothetical protein [Acholeplasmataceae bacterium]
MTLQTALYIVYGFIGLSILLFLSIFYQRLRNLSHEKKQGLARDFLFQKYFDLVDIPMPFTSRFFLDAFIDVETQVDIEPDVRSRIISDLWVTKFMQKQKRYIHALSKNKRRIAIFYIQAMNHEEALTLLKNRLLIEKDETTKFMLIYALKNSLDQVLFDHILMSLEHASKNYRQWIYAISKNHFQKIKPFINSYITDERTFVMDYLIHLASHSPDMDLKAYLLSLIQNNDLDQTYIRKAFQALAKMHPEEVTKEIYCKNEDIEIKKIAMTAAGNIPQQKMVDHLLSSVDGSSLDEIRIQSLSRIVYDSKAMLIYLLEFYTKARDV